MRLVAHQISPSSHLVAPWRSDLRLEWDGPAPSIVTFRGATLPVDQSPLTLPSIEGELVARRGEEVLRVRIQPAGGTRPPIEDIELLRAWAVLTQKLGLKTWRDLRRVPLLAIESLLHRLQRTAVDDLLLKRGRAAISRIAARPRTYIRTEDERRPIGKVNRPARDAERELSRSGDAIRVGRRTVPQQLLTTFTEEEFGIYENRVLVTVILRLRERVYRRIAEIRDAFNRITKLSESINRLHNLRQFKRLGRLRQATDRDRPDWLNTALSDAKSLEEELNGQLSTFEAALTRPVGMSLRRDSRIHGPLRETNILSFDPDYSLLPLIWRTLDREQGHPLDLRLDDPDGAFADLCQVGLAHALDELGFQIPASSAELWCAGGNGCGQILAPGPSGPAGAWSVRLGRKRDETGWRFDLDFDWCAASPPNPTGSNRHVAPGAARVAQSPTSKPQTIHRLRLRPTFSPDASACPSNVEDGRQTVWVHPVGQLPVADDVSLRCLNFHTGPEGRRHPISLGLHPADWASADRLGRLIRRFTLWTDLENRRIPEDCPTCGGASRAEGLDRGCLNKDCEARWGVRTCNNDQCKKVIPKLLPRVPPDHALDELLLDYPDIGRKRQLFSELGGRDMLADWPLFPDLNPERDRCNDMLACPHCGAS